MFGIGGHPERRGTVFIQRFRKTCRRDRGVIVPCVQMAHLEIGRINQDNLVTIWQTHPELQKLRQRHNIPLTRFSECRNCPYLMYGTGNCPALAYTLTGDINRPVRMHGCIAQNYYRSKNLWAPFWYCDQAQRLGLFPKSRIRP